MSQTKDPLVELHGLLTNLNASCQAALGVGPYFTTVVAKGRESVKEVTEVVKALAALAQRAYGAIAPLYELGAGPVKGLFVYQADPAAKNLRQLTGRADVAEALTQWVEGATSFHDDTETRHAELAKWFAKHGEQALRRAGEVRALQAGSAEDAVAGVSAVLAWARSTEDELDTVDENWSTVIDTHGGEKASHLRLHAMFSEQLEHIGMCHVAIQLACGDYLARAKTVSDE